MEITMTRFSGKTLTANWNVRRSPLAWVQGTPALWFLLDFFRSYCTSKYRLKSESRLWLGTRCCTIQAFFISETIQYHNNQA